MKDDDHKKEIHIGKFFADICTNLLKIGEQLLVKFADDNNFIISVRRCYNSLVGG